MLFYHQRVPSETYGGIENWDWTRGWSRTTIWGNWNWIQGWNLPTTDLRKLAQPCNHRRLDKEQDWAWTGHLQSFQRLNSPSFILLTGVEERKEPRCLWRNRQYHLLLSDASKCSQGDRETFVKSNSHPNPNLKYLKRVTKGTILQIKIKNTYKTKFANILENLSKR